MIDRVLAMVGLARREPQPEPQPEPRSITVAQMAKVWRVLAGYDSARSDGANAAHWASADELAAWSANSPEVRNTLRKRARYEVGNHSLVAGMMRTLANHTIGIGPRLRIDTGSRTVDREIEWAWKRWARQVRLAKKLRIMRRAKCIDGEAFAVMFTNHRLPEITLDLRLIEADQVATPDLSPDDERAIDGVRFDDEGNATQYHILRRHPGDDRALGGFLDYDAVAADVVFHYAHATRPGEVRGVPELTPALALGAILRRYVLATLLNAEHAANISGVLESEHPEVVPAQLAEDLEAIQLEPGSFLNLPEGWKAKGFKAEQPVTGFREFRREMANEFARCIDMPLNIALASSQEYNFASGRLDHGVYLDAIAVERDEIEELILDRLFEAWVREALLVPGLIRGRVAFEDIDFAWRWPAFRSGDPEKDANAAAALRKARLLSLDRYYSEQHGSDWERELEQDRREQEYADELEIDIYESAPQPAAVGAGGQDEEVDE